MQELEDVIIKDGGDNPNDIIIVVIGPTGAGKSTFINTLFNDDVTAIGYGQNRCTTNLKPIIYPRRFGSAISRRLIVVDTPGFDENSPGEVVNLLTRVSVWMEASYNNQMRVGGFIYIHDISQETMQTKPPPRNLRETLRRLSGDESSSSTILGTTKWSKIGVSLGNDRLYDLKRNFWRYFDQQRSVMVKFRDNHESAIEIVEILLKRFSVCSSFESSTLKVADLIMIASDPVIRNSQNTSAMYSGIMYSEENHSRYRAETHVPTVPPLEPPRSTTNPANFTPQSSYYIPPFPCPPSSGDINAVYCPSGILYTEPESYLYNPPSLSDLFPEPMKPRSELGAETMISTCVEPSARANTAFKETNGAECIKLKEMDDSLTTSCKRIVSTGIKQESCSTKEVVEFEATRTQSSFYKASRFTMHGTSMVDGVASGASLTSECLQAT
ncbi:hypothetical protein BDQ17DRAFT_1428240 [Cyathus striatus]|nr:hypothetical protein BDQ17DRAFT_1428240 [Cyathus striatus]